MSGPLLNDLLLRADGSRVHNASAWAQHRATLAAALPVVYGDAPAPVPARWEELHRATVRSGADGLGGCTLVSGRVHLRLAAAPGVSVWGLQLWLPATPGPHPVVLSGDACWHYTTDAVKALLLQRGYALALFNRAEVAPDPVDPRQRAVQRGAVAWWAWAFHRCVDALCVLPELHPQRIAVVGHSRGGKAALLAGATDPRIALTSANNSGAGGAGSFRSLGPGAETLADLVREFPHWFAPGLAGYVGREADLPMDGHTLKALVAPRALFTTEALGDLWANPQGTQATHDAARAVYAMLGATDRIGIRWRAGGHAHQPDDWAALLDFADALWARPGA